MKAGREMCVPMAILGLALLWYAAGFVVALGTLILFWAHLVEKH